MKWSDIEIVGSIDPSEMPPHARGNGTTPLGPATQQILDDAVAGRVTVFRLPKGTSATEAQQTIQGGRNRAFQKRGFRMRIRTQRDSDGTLVVYVHCVPIEQNGHQP